MSARDQQDASITLVNLSSGTNKCDRCTAKCCGYITQAIDTPKSIKDFDILLWQIAHKGIHIFKDGNGWYLLSSTPCQFLLDDYRCGIYETRPLICREHSNDSCEFDVPIDEGCYLYFQNYQQLDDYCRNRYKTWDKRLIQFDRKHKRSRK